MVTLSVGVPQPRAGETACVHLLRGPFVTVAGRRRDVPEGSKRLLAFVALSRGPLDRRYAAGSLWPDVCDKRAAGNMRSALWRLRSASVDVVDSDTSRLCLKAATTVDVEALSDWAGEVLDRRVPTESLRDVEWPSEWPSDALDLLPGWYDDWVIFERERLRQRLLHALEVLALRLARQRRFPEAVEAALLAVQGEPLRESAQRALVTVHLAEGNLIEARRAYLRYADMLAHELGVRPGPELTGLLGWEGSPASEVPEELRMLTVER